MRPKRGDILEFDVEGLAYGGRGVCRTNGFVVFVDNALPGDHIEAEVTKSKKNYAEARTVRVIEVGPDRVKAECVHSGELCPGAPWQELAYERQIQIKAEQVREALERIGGLSDFEMEPIREAQDVWRYRNKLEYSFGAGSDGRLALGFHKRGNWQQVVDVDDCLLASHRSNEIRNFARDWFRDRGIEAYDRKSRAGFLRNLVVREGRYSGQIQVRLITSEGIESFDSDEFTVDMTGEFSQVSSLIWTVNSGTAEVSRGDVDDLKYGVEWIEEEVSGLRFRIPYDAFFQTNSAMMQELVETASEYADLKGDEHVFDLYCGIGTMGLLLASRAGMVYGIDIVDDAVRSANENAQANRIDNARFFSGNARTAIRPLVEEVGSADVVVIDPPRAGLSQKVVRRVLETGAKRIVYVSCNPTTLAPNAAQMVEAGYKLVKVRPVDMFPNTPHIECVALLER